jgi:hypothetical protein
VYGTGIKIDGTIEAKCLMSVGEKKLEEVANDPDPKVRNKLCLHIREGKLQLKRNHRYYYQVQGQLQITQCNSGYFIVYSENDFHSEVIKRDDDLWYNQMLPKLNKFYMECLLPEIIDPRVPRGRNCRDPQYILDAQIKHKSIKEAQEAKKQQKLQLKTKQGKKKNNNS